MMQSEKLSKILLASSASNILKDLFHFFEDCGTFCEFVTEGCEFVTKSLFSARFNFKIMPIF